MRLCGGPTEADGEQVDPELVRANRRDGESRLPTPASPKTGAQKRSPTRKNSHKTSTLGGNLVSLPTLVGKMNQRE